MCIGNRPLTRASPTTGARPASGSQSVCIVGVYFWSIRLLRQHDTLLCHSFFFVVANGLATQTRNVGPATYGYPFGCGMAGTLSLAFMGSGTVTVGYTATDFGWDALGCASTRGDFTVVYWGTGVGRGKRQGTGRGRVWARKATQCGAGRILDFLLAGLAGTLSAVGELTRVHNMPCY